MYRNADVRNVVQALEDCREESDHGHLSVYETEATMVGITNEEMKDRNLYQFSDHLCSIEWESSGLIHLKFHEKVVDGTFALIPAGTQAIDPIQATQPEDLSSDLKPVVDRLSGFYDIHKWDFAEVKGASIANGGHICDFEFEYEAFTW